MHASLPDAMPDNAVMKIDEPIAARDFAEEFGLFLEQSGLPPMAGRILGWLLVCEPAQQSAADLMLALGASKGSISMVTRLLVNLGLIERVAVPERRERYFRIRPGVWTDLLATQMARTAEMRVLAERGLVLVADQGEESRARLEELHHLYSFMEREMPVLLERWARERSGDGG
jgi:DNA-binding transcriptional regulator GbsR (MarR family)